MPDPLGWRVARPKRSDKPPIGFEHLPLRGEKTPREPTSPKPSRVPARTYTNHADGAIFLRNLTYDANGGYGTYLAGRLARVDYGSGNAWTELCAYDPAGGMVSKKRVWSRTGPTYTYTFDSMARPLSLSDDGSGDVSLGTQSFYAQGQALPIYGLGLSGGTVLNNPYSTRAVTMNNIRSPRPCGSKDPEP